MLIAIDYSLDQSREIAIAGNPEDKKTKILIGIANEKFHPNQVVSVGPQDGKDIPLLKARPMKSRQSTAYVCINQVCNFPTNDAGEMKRLLAKVAKYKLKN